jgi:group I intron endonuclease
LGKKQSLIGMMIYKITNKINNMLYIGQTIQPLKKRWSDHIYSSKNLRNRKKDTSISYLHRSIQKYGKENFTIEEIDGANSQSELNYKEWLLINKFNTLAPNGYNLREGGRNKGKATNKLSKKLSESSSLKIPVKCLNNGIVYKSMTEASKQLGIKNKSISKVCNGLRNHTHGYRFEFVDEKLKAKALKNKQKRIVKRNSSIKKQKIKVICVDTQEIFESINDAAEKYNTTNAMISSVCYKKVDSYKGMHFDFVDERLKEKSDIIKKDRQERLKKQYDSMKRKIICEDTGVIYESISQAALEMGLHKSSVNNVCLNRQKTTKGYVFRYYNGE